MLKDILTIVGLAIGTMAMLAGLAIITPLLYAAGGYLTGWVLSVVFPFAGQWIVNGADVLGIEIALSSLPVIGATLGFLGSFFKSTQTNKTEK